MVQYDRRKLGSWLKEKREAAEFTQHEVARKLGYTSPQFISNMERGITATPMRALAKFIKLYKASPEPVLEIILSMQKELLGKELMKARGKAPKAPSH